MPDQMQSRVTLHERTPSSPFNLQQALQRFERGYLQNMLQLAQWDLQEAAQMLEITPETLQTKIHTYQLIHQ